MLIYTFVPHLIPVLQLQLQLLEQYRKKEKLLENHSQFKAFWA
jgi:hypothetical protein